MAKTNIEPYLSFPGTAEQAMNFYVKCFDGEIMFLSRFSDLPEEDADVGRNVDPNLILHATVKLGESPLMMSDDPGPNFLHGNHMAVTWSTDDEQQLRTVWNNFVAEGATVKMELEPSFFSPLFGVIEDPFGIQWMLMMYDENEEQWTP